MDRKYLAFDIEIAKVLPANVQNLKAHRPLGITCAAALAEDENVPHLWYSRDQQGSPAPQMARENLSELVDFLQQQVAQGYTILTWNGLSFDFDILAEESGRSDECRELAANHIDMMFHVLCIKGFPVSLEAAAKALLPQGKPSNVTGAIVPKLWAEGHTDTVLDYVVNDCKITLEVAKISEDRKRFCWITQRGKKSDFRLASGKWKTVKEANRLPLPDISWMSTRPLPRSHFTSWLN